MCALRQGHRSGLEVFTALEGTRSNVSKTGEKRCGNVFAGLPCCCVQVKHREVDCNALRAVVQGEEYSNAGREFPER